MCWIFGSYLAVMWTLILEVEAYTHNLSIELFIEAWKKNSAHAFIFEPSVIALGWFAKAL